MTKEIPLSLQVFHSRNEFEAQRLNRTEQIRLRGLHDVLKREEKLYIKDHELFRQRFQSHYTRRRSDAGVGNANNIVNCNNNTNQLYNVYQNTTRISASRNNGRPMSVSSRMSVVSAPGKLQTNRPNSVDHALASKMCSSFGEISSMTRFQRVQRKFSLASFTENGLLTKSGSRMTENIDKAREILFNTKNKERFELPKIGVGKVANKVGPATSKTESASNLNNQDQSVVIVKHSPEHGNGDGKLLQPDKLSLDQQIVQPEVENTSISFETAQPDSQDTERKSLVILGSIEEEFTNSRSSFRKEQNSSFDTAKITNSNLSQNNTATKKKVKILSHLEGNITDAEDNKKEEEETSRDKINEETSRDFTEWRSIFSKSLNMRMDPLQQKINVFLSDQKDFNKIFPKRFDGVTTQMSDDHKELASIGREKREQESRDRKKKNEIVLEVLNTLGIEDNHITGLYQE